jgi:hypothetical protein
MNHLTTMNILDLPDELLLTIFNKLNSIDVLYSLIGVNQKLDKLAQDITFSRSLDFVAILSNEENDPKINSVLDRFCTDILPQVHHNIECLTLEPSLLECVLYTGEYPKLRKLTLVNLKLETLSRILTSMYLIISFVNGENRIFSFIFRVHLDESLFIHKVKYNISHVTFKIHDYITTEYMWNLVTNIYAHIYVALPNLTHLEFDLEDTCGFPPTPFCKLPTTSCYSSRISYLRIRVYSLDDCLYLLDGRLSQLHTFIVEVDHMRYCDMTYNKTVRSFEVNRTRLLSKEKQNPIY